MDACQSQHDAGLIMSNLQVLGQFVTSLSRMSSEVKRLAFCQEVFPSVAVQAISASPRVHRAAHYMAAMGLWRPAEWPGCSRACASFVMQQLYDVYRMFS